MYTIRTLAFLSLNCLINYIIVVMLIEKRKSELHYLATLFTNYVYYHRYYSRLHFKLESNFVPYVKYKPHQLVLYL